MKIKTSGAVVAMAAALTFGGAGIATADPVNPNSPEGVWAGIVQGVQSAFGSSGQRQQQPRGGNAIYPDYSSCNQAAANLRQRGYIAECNPLGGVSSQYQLVYIPK